MRLRSRAFTLIELLVVMAIVATLLSLVAPKYFQHIDRSKETVLRQNLAQIRDALDKYYADRGRYPDTLDDLVERKYLRRPPVDPVTESTSTWVLLPPDDTSKGGVSDLRSGAQGKTSDGIPFSEL